MESGRGTEAGATPSWVGRGEQLNTLPFSNHELITAMIKAKGIRRGIWALYVNFQFSAMNLPVGEDLRPASSAVITEYGLVQAEQEGPMAVDAAKVNSLIYHA